MFPVLGWPLRAGRGTGPGSLRLCWATVIMTEHGEESSTEAEPSWNTWDWKCWPRGWQAGKVRG